MRLRTNKRLAALANENCMGVPLGYDFTKSKWLNIHVWYQRSYKNISRQQIAFSLGDRTRRTVRRAIVLPKYWSYADKPWIKTPVMVRHGRYKPPEVIS
jgi:hypothetical protein